MLSIFGFVGFMLQLGCSSNPPSEENANFVPLQRTSKNNYKRKEEAQEGNSKQSILYRTVLKVISYHHLLLKHKNTS